VGKIPSFLTLNQAQHVIKISVTVGCRRYGTEVVWAGGFRILMAMFYYYYYYLLKFIRWQ
jgi:hypothetical protein